MDSIPPPSFSSLLPSPPYPPPAPSLPPLARIRCKSAAKCSRKRRAQAFRDCAGSTDEDRENPLLEEELRSRQGDGKGVGEIYILPTIRINGGQYRGRLSYTEVFRAGVPSQTPPPSHLLTLHPA